MTTWAKFLTALMWAVGVAEAAFGMLRRAPAQQTRQACSGAATVPTLGTHGVDVEGWREVAIVVDLMGAAGTASYDVYLYDGSVWYRRLASSVSLDAASDGQLVLAEVVDNVGFSRVYVNVTASSDAAVAYALPTNE